MTSTNIHWHPLTSTDIHGHSLTFTDIHWHPLTSTDINWHPLTFPDIHWHPLTSISYTIYSLVKQRMVLNYLEKHNSGKDKYNKYIKGPKNTVEAKVKDSIHGFLLFQSLLPPPFSLVGWPSLLPILYWINTIICQITQGEIRLHQAVTLRIRKRTYLPYCSLRN